MPEDNLSQSLLVRDGGSVNSANSTPSRRRIQSMLSESNVFTESEPVTGHLALVENSTGDGNVPPSIITLRKSDVLIGRGADCHVTLSSLQISRKHCGLEFRNDSWFIRDTSTNGLTVATTRLVKGQLHPLNDRDLIQLVPTGTLSYRYLKLNNNSTSGRLATSITLDSDEDSLLSVEDENEHVEDICVNEPAAKVMKFGDSSKNQDQIKCEQKSVQIIEDISSPTAPSPQRQGRPSIIFTPTKRPRPPSPDSPSQFDSQSSQSQSLLCIKKQKTELPINELLKQIQDLKEENALMKFEHMVEKEENAQQRETEVAYFKEQYKEELCKNFSDALESEFSCCICSGVFVEPTISPSCGHTYCQYCITEWLQKKPECPICRSRIPLERPPNRHIEMGNFIAKVFDVLGEDYKEKREAQLKDRQNEKLAAAAAAASAAQATRLQNERNQRQQRQMQLEMINEMQAFVSGVPRRRAPRAVAVPAAAGAGPTAPPVARRGSRRRNNAGAVDVNNAAAAAAAQGLPGGHPGLVQTSANTYNHLAGMPNLFGINPRTARHPYFQMPMPHLPFHTNFLNNNTNNNSDVLMID